MSDKKPPTIENDLPDVERRVEESKARHEHASPTDDAMIRQQEAAVEKAIENLPEKQIDLLCPFGDRQPPAVVVMGPQNARANE